MIFYNATLFILKVRDVHEPAALDVGWVTTEVDFPIERYTPV
jgi:hypothetical protein